MTPPTTDELLRLARKAWPGRDVRVIERVSGWCVESVTYDVVLLKAPLERLHAALLVLAGELDVAALLAERDRLRPTTWCC